MSDILTEEQIDELTRRAIDGADGPLTDRELEAVLAWGSRKVGGYLAFRAVLAGRARVAVKGGQVTVVPAGLVH